LVLGLGLIRLILAGMGQVPTYLVLKQVKVDINLIRPQVPTSVVRFQIISVSYGSWPSVSEFWKKELDLPLNRTREPRYRTWTWTKPLDLF
jgi:hypothetical protein